VEWVSVRLDEPPAVVNLGVGVHGTSRPRDVFRLPDLWQSHLYGYAGELAVGGHAMKLALPRAEAVRTRDLVHRHEADVVAVAGVFAAGIAEADEEFHPEVP
jgi:hypothetical protein